MDRKTCLSEAEAVTTAALKVARDVEDLAAMAEVASEVEAVHLADMCHRSSPDQDHFPPDQDHSGPDLVTTRIIIIVVRLMSTIAATEGLQTLVQASI